MKLDLTTLTTESTNPNSQYIDRLPTLAMLEVIQQEDEKVPQAIKAVLPNIALAVDKIADAFRHSGRLIYCGAGTSGRLGILDASECPPTYGSDPEQVIGLIAGGHAAILRAVENAEDNAQQGAVDLQEKQIQANDVLVGIAASGRTPYVIGAMRYAKSIGACVVSLACNPNSEMAKIADIEITPEVGAEVVTGSSRMKAGTAQKLVLNMLTTGSMIKVGKVYGNLMVDVAASNQKLLDRQTRIVMMATECDEETAESTLNLCQRHCKTAILMLLMNWTLEEAQIWQETYPYQPLSDCLS